MTDLPPGWVETTLGEIAETSLGKMLDRGKATGTHLVPYLRNLNVQWGRINLDDVLVMDIHPEERAFFQLRDGDLLICEGGEIGRCAIWLGGVEYMAFQKALHRVRPHGGVDPKYLRYYLEQMSLSGALLPFATGSTIKHLPQQQLRRLPIKLPPLLEQRRIVAALEDHISRLQAGMSDMAVAEKKLKLWRSSLYNAAISGRFPPSAGRWRRVSIGELAKVGTGTTPSRSNKDYYDDGTIPWVTSSLLNKPYIGQTSQCITEKALAETSVKVWPVGTVLIAMYGEGRTRGRCSELLIPAACNQACAAIIFRDENKDRIPWVKLALEAMYEKNRRLASGGVQPNLNLSLVRSIEIPLPSLEEQQVILAEVDRQESRASMVADLLERGQVKARALRRYLLAEAFAGRLVPQDSIDEPASVLLGRIRTERGAASARTSRMRRNVERDRRKKPSQKETLL